VEICICCTSSFHADDIPYTIFNGDTSSPDLEGGIVNYTVAGVWQNFIVNFAETGTPNPNLAPKFTPYSRGALFNTNATALGCISTDVDDSFRCKYW
jgi:hypothetical protein